MGYLWLTQSWHCVGKSLLGALGKMYDKLARTLILSTAFADRGTVVRFVLQTVMKTLIIIVNNWLRINL